MSGRCIKWGLLILTPIWVLVIFVIFARAELPPGMVLCVEERIDTLWQPHRTRYSAALDSMIRADSLNSCYDSVRPRQRLNHEDSLWLLIFALSVI